MWDPFKRKLGKVWESENGLRIFRLKCCDEEIYNANLDFPGANELTDTFPWNAKQKYQLTHWPLEDVILILEVKSLNRCYEWSYDEHLKFLS